MIPRTEKVEVVGSGYCACCPFCELEKQTLKFYDSKSMSYEVEWNCKYAHICKRVADIFCRKESEDDGG